MTRDTIADYLGTLLLVYTVLIFIRILLSYFRNIPYNRVLAAVIGFVTDVTDPYLNLFRRVVPPLRIGPGAIDLSPIIGIVVLNIVFGYILIPLVRG